MHGTREFVTTVSLVLIATVATRLLAAETTESAVLAAEHQWLRAEQTNNVALLTPLLAEKIVLTTKDGRVLSGRDAVLADAKATTWSTAEYRSLRVTVFGQTAVATGTFLGKGADQRGDPFQYHRALHGHLGKDAGWRLAMRSRA
jgi:ketosteroid isomerase-like protein